jgi:hypothetical protein
MAAALAALTASSCLVNRVVEVRGQVCAFEDHFDIDLAGSASIAFREPVLLENDVHWLAGAAPTREFKRNNGLTMVYEVEKVGAATGTAPEFWLALDFRPVDGLQRLERLRVDPALIALLGPELPDHAALAAAAREACDNTPALLSRTVELPITEEELELLPSRDELLAWLGEPLNLDTSTGRIDYAYRLKSRDEAPPTARMAIWYDAEGTRPLRMESEYSRFRSEADFEARTLTMNVEL